MSSFSCSCRTRLEEVDTHALWALVGSVAILVVAGSFFAPLFPGGRNKGVVIGLSVVTIIFLLFFWFAFSNQPPACAVAENC
jgi:Na+/melibiose symporter-like transporter